MTYYQCLCPLPLCAYCKENSY
uniref:Uncharacterized protein n=1 Tax=Arundo donax TaxID=35708 RepID=A0A0A8ZKW6_ARUDO